MGKYSNMFGRQHSLVRATREEGTGCILSVGFSSQAGAGVRAEKPEYKE